MNQTVWKRGGGSICFISEWVATKKEGGGGGVSSMYILQILPAIYNILAHPLINDTFSPTFILEIIPIFFPLRVSKMIFDGRNSNPAVSHQSGELQFDDWGIIISVVHLKNCLTLGELN